MENCSRSDKEPSLKDLYELTREHITHEDDLVNSRLTWFLVVQSLLFAAYGVVLNITQGDGLNTLQTAIPWVGIAASILVFSSVLGARLAILHMKKYWEGHDPNEIKYFPSIVCKPCPRWLGNIEAFLLPIVFVSVWIYISNC